MFHHDNLQVSDCCKTQEIRNRAINTYPSAIELVPENYKTQEMCNNVVDACPFKFDSIPNQYKNRDV